MSTRYYYHPVCLEHVTPPGHPERPDRLRAVEQALEEERYHLLERVQAPFADPQWFTLIHPQPYLDAIEARIPETGMAAIDGDTAVSPKSWQAVLAATGAAMDAVDAVFRGEANNAFAAMRPPGHHAEKTTAMGFCLVNSIALAARYAQKKHGAERVAIVDFDVHHGNGTQDIFWDDPTVMFASTHQMPLFPGTGALNETGVGNVLNAPLRDGDGSDHFREAMREYVLPKVRDFNPDLVLISAGFDGHFRDPLAGLNLTKSDYDWITGKLMDIADDCCEDRVVSLLEGGYDLQGLGESVAVHVDRLMHG